MPHAGGYAADAVEVAAHDAGARNPPSRTALYDARDAERPDAANLRVDVAGRSSNRPESQGFTVSGNRLSAFRRLVRLSRARARDRLHALHSEFERRRRG